MASKTVFATFLLSLFLSLSLCSAGNRLGPKDILNFHNYYRCLHGTQPLAWDNGLAASAQKWAFNRQNAGCVMIHSGYSQLGENIAAGTWRGPTGYNYWLSEDDVVSAWYHEPFTYGSTASPTLNHFTQVVWHGSTHVGCAWASCQNTTEEEFWVCQYTPQGNWNDATTVNQNVPRPCRTQAQCQFVLQNVDLNSKFGGDSGKVSTALTANQINPATYNYGAQTCKTGLSAYTAATNPFCVTDSTVLPKTIDVTVQNPTSTGALTTKINCPSGKALSGTGLVTCNSDSTWNIAGTCGGTPIIAGPNPPAPAPVTTTTRAPTPAPATPTGCWGATLMGVYLPGYPSGWSYVTGLTQAQAKAACQPLNDCAGITHTGSGWEPRSGATPYSSGSGENSILRLASCNTPTTAAPTPVAPAGKCWGGLLSNTYLYLYPSGYSPPATSTLQDAQAACAKYSDCGGVTYTGGHWEARKGTVPMPSSTGEKSYLVVPCVGASTQSVVAWSGNSVVYSKGQCVQYNGKNYICTQPHVSYPGWDPVNAPSLWQPSNTCGVSSAESKTPIQERVPWLIPVVAAVGGVLLITTVVVLFKKRKQDRWRAYSGDLGTPEVPAVESEKKYEKVEVNHLTTTAITSPTTITETPAEERELPPPLETSAGQKQPAYTQVPTSPMKAESPRMENSQAQNFPLSPSAAEPTESQALFSQAQTRTSPEPPKVPSSSEWTKQSDPKTGQTYYYNQKSGITQWEVPDGC